MNRPPYHPGRRSFTLAPPTMAELEKRELDERLQRAAEEYDRTLRTDVTRGEFEDLVMKFTLLEERLTRS